MSEIAAASAISLVLSDMAMVDGMGKLNVLGGGVAVLGFDAAQGLTSRFALSVMVRVPSRLLPADLSVEVSLVRDGLPVVLPGPAGDTPLRIGQPISMDKPQQQAAPTPQIREHIGSTHKMVFDFSNGLPLAMGGTYEWVVRIDGDEEHDTKYPFAVGTVPPAPVFG